MRNHEHGDPLGRARLLLRTGEVIDLYLKSMSFEFINRNFYTGRPERLAGTIIERIDMRFEGSVLHEYAPGEHVDPYEPDRKALKPGTPELPPGPIDGVILEDE